MVAERQRVRLVCGPEGSPNFCFGHVDVFVQSDWEYPGLASSLGWSLADVRPGGGQAEAGAGCRHEGTDGTVDCKACGATVQEFLTAAYDWLDAHDGDEFDWNE